jgi:hypothetical protein
MNDALRNAIRYKVTNYPRAPANQPCDAREVRCWYCSRPHLVGARCCSPGDVRG